MLTMDELMLRMDELKMRWRDENKAPEAAQSSAFPDRVFLSSAPLLGDDGS